MRVAGPTSWGTGIPYRTEAGRLCGMQHRRSGGPQAELEAHCLE
ncbi:MAG: hypothetical protein WBI17_09400 [Clostridiaceae bacterium]